LFINLDKVRPFPTYTFSDKIRIRGFASVSIHMYIVFIAMLSVAVAANGNGLDDEIRHQIDLLEGRIIVKPYIIII